MTGMALQSLAPYYSRDPAVQEAVDRAIARLSQMQNDDGGFSTFSGSGGKVATSESASQVIVALAALGIDPHTVSVTPDPNYKVQSITSTLIPPSTSWMFTAMVMQRAAALARILTP